MDTDFRQIAKDAVEQLKIYETEIQGLREQLQLKKQASCVDPVLLKKSVEALVKKGSINTDQFDETMNLLNSDPNASLRAITALCESSSDARTLVKKESTSLDGGTLVKDAGISVSDRDMGYHEVAKALGLTLN